MNKKITKVLLRAIGILVSLYILFALDYLVNEIEYKDPVNRKTKTSIKENFNQYGLSMGQELSHDPFYEDENYVFYTDRLLKKSNYSREQIESSKAVLDNLSQIIPQEVKTYIIPLPGRIIWEDNYQEETRSYRNFLSALKTVVPKHMNFLDVLPTLKEHKDEYLFFRTDDSWTARGAYYGSKLLLKHMGVIPIPLEEYDEHMYSKFNGIDKEGLIKNYGISGENIEKLREIQEPNYYYLLPDSKNRATRTKKWNDTVITEKIKIVSKTRTGKAAFIGNNYLWAVAEGEGKNEERKEKTVLLLCDLRGHIMVPFLSPYYDKVYVVNILNYQYNREEFQNIFRKYNISEVILAQKGEDIGNPSRSKFFTDIMKSGNKE